MGISVLNPAAASGGGIKSVQRGSAGGAGNVTITAVDISKSFVTVFGTTSSGTVAASGSINASTGNNSSGTINNVKMVMQLPAPINGSFGSSNPAIRYSSYDSGDTQSSGGVGGYGDSAVGTINALTSTLPSVAYNANSTNLTGGSNNLVAAVVQGYLSNSTTLVVSGACRWEVVEFN